jgi:hypothetical protein
MRRLILLSGLLCVLLFSVAIPLLRVDGHLVGSNGLSYYAILRSMVFDRDFDYTNDYPLMGVEFSRNFAGLPPNPFAIGTPLLWLPFFLLTHLVSVVLVGLGFQVPLNGVSYIYEASVCYGTIVYATLGFLLTYEVAKRITSAAVAGIAVLLMWWATPDLLYCGRALHVPRDHPLHRWVLPLGLVSAPTGSYARRVDSIGVATGLVMIGRWQDGILMLLPAAEQLWWLTRRRLPLRRAVQQALALWRHDHSRLSATGLYVARDLRPVAHHPSGK